MQKMHWRKNSAPVHDNSSSQIRYPPCVKERLGRTYSQRGEKTECFLSPVNENRKGCQLFPFLFSIVLEGLQFTKTRRRKKSPKDQKEGGGGNCHYSGNMVTYMENPKESHKGIQQGCRIRLVYKNQMYFYILVTSN